MIEGVHLVGSAPVQEPVQMFEMACRHVGSHIRRLGDGEIGERNAWIRWQFAKLGQCPQLALSAATRYLGRTVEQYEILHADRPLELVSPGYARAALDSYAAFRQARAAGVVPAHVRFMVGLPTPLSVVTLYVAPGSRRQVLEAYQARLLSELRQITAAIPAHDLSIQWEVCIEFGILEGLWSYLDEEADPGGVDSSWSAGIAGHVCHLARQVPEAVELGFHLCYGDAGHQHFVEPEDATHLAWLSRQILNTVERRVSWIHMPVPRDRDDVEYFKPLAGLALSDATELYLGLVHETGGVAATRRRIAAAQQVVPRFGVATECGLGRRDLHSLPDLLDQHAALAAPIAGS